MNREKRIWECSQCEEETSLSVLETSSHPPKCLVCGMELKLKQDPAANLNSTRSLFRFAEPLNHDGNPGTRDAFNPFEGGLQSLGQLNPDILMDLIHPDLRTFFEQLIQEESPNKVVNQKHLDEIGHLLVDRRKTVLWDVSLTIGPAHCLLILAEFSSIPNANTEIDTEIVLGDPPQGDRLPESDLSEIQGKCVLLERGTIPFLQKYQTYALQSLSTLIISQTKGYKFPFIMTGDAQSLPVNTVNEEQLTRYPVAMISDHDYNLIKKILTTEAQASSSSSSSKGRLPCKIKVTTPVQDCPICVESFECGQEIYKLLCRHIYHRHCLSRWVQSHPHCPLCRQPIQKKSTEKEEERDSSNQQEREDERSRLPGMARDFYR